MAHVLVANADADMRELLVELLTEAGHKVLPCAMERSPGACSMRSPPVW